MIGLSPVATLARPCPAAYTASRALALPADGSYCHMPAGVKALSTALLAVALLLSSLAQAQWTPPGAPQISNASLVGTYQRQPAINGWHTGTIELAGGWLRWTNRAGVSWNLNADLANKVLHTDNKNPYYSQGARSFELQISNGRVTGFRFNGEIYKKTGTSAPPPNNAYSQPPRTTTNSRPPPTGSYAPPPQVQQQLPRGNTPLRYADRGDGTVQDTLTGLFWLRNSSCFADLASRSWNEAVSAAASLESNFCGLRDGSRRGDWRLPTREEWEKTLAPVRYSSDTSRWTQELVRAFPDLAVGFYWSATSAGVNSAWGGELRSGRVATAGTGYGVGARHIWPVRNGLVARSVPPAFTLPTTMVLGSYQRQPVQNGWHSGSITQNGKWLRWTNQAGVSWNLTPDMPNNKLYTDQQNPYYQQGAREFNLLVRNGVVEGFVFNRETYRKTSISSSRPGPAPGSGLGRTPAPQNAAQQQADALARARKSAESARGQSRNERVRTVREEVEELKRDLRDESPPLAVLSTKTGQFKDGTGSTFRLGQFSTGYNYVIVGVCDDGCVDLDITLFDKDGRTVDDETGWSTSPDVEVKPPFNQSYSAHVEMADCMADPCQWGFVVSRHPLQTAASKARKVAQMKRAVADGERGFRDDGHSIVYRRQGRLVEEAETKVTLGQFQSGRTYGVAGFCDDDCSDFTIELMDSGGRVIDDASGSEPEIELSPPSSRNYNLRVTMDSCSDDPCEFGILVVRAAR